MDTLNASVVQSFLNELDPSDEFKITFKKKDGSVAEYQATLPYDEKRSESVAIFTEEGYKRFNINNVISVERVEQ